MKDKRRYIVFSKVLLLSLIGCSGVSNFTESYDHKNFVYLLSTPRNHPVTQPRFRIPNLEEALNESNPVVRNNALMDLTALAKTDPKAAEALFRTLENRDPLVRRTAACTLGKIGASPTPLLIEVLAEVAERGTYDQRVSALNSLSNYGDRSKEAAAAYAQYASEVLRLDDGVSWRRQHLKHRQVQHPKRVSTQEEETLEEYNARLAQQKKEASEVSAKVQADIIKRYGSIEKYEAVRSAKQPD